MLVDDAIARCCRKALIIWGFMMEAAGATTSTVVSPGTKLSPNFSTEPGKKIFAIVQAIKVDGTHCRSTQSFQPDTPIHYDAHHKRTPMKTATTLSTLTTVANFPEHFMLENLAVRADGSILVVASPQRQVWYVPPANKGVVVQPLLLHTFDDGQLAQCFVEAQPDIFYVATYGRATLHRFDLRGWEPGAAVTPTKILDFEPPAGPNGGCLIAPGVMLFSDCVEGLIWRVDLSDDGLHATARVWLKHDTMAAGAGKPPVRFSATMEVPFPGINGLRYGPKTNFVYYTTSSQDLFMRVAVDPSTREPAGEPEFIAKVQSVDDLSLDENDGVAYLARHPDHIVEREPLKRNSSGMGRAIVAGEPFSDKLIGPTSIDWGRGADDYGRVAYVTTDGGTVKLAPDGVLRPARLMRIEFAVAEGAGVAPNGL